MLDGDVDYFTLDPVAYAPARSAHAPAVDALIAQLRETHRRRTRLQQEFDRAALP